MTPEQQRQIDDNLRRIYQDAMREELPDRFDTLLNMLRDQDQDTANLAFKETDN